MTVRIAICVLLMAASGAWAQDSPVSTINDMRRQIKGIGNATEQRRENAAKQLGLTAAPSQANPSAHAIPAASGQTGSPAASDLVSAHKRAAAKRKPASTRVVVRPAKKSDGKTNGEQAADKPKTVSLRGRRDPFQTIIRSEPIDHSAGCATGKKCLVVDRIDLKGVVRSQNGMIAVVENQQRKTYFLHENDPVFNGHVVRIGPDSVVFQETVVDRVGRRSTRDVVKRISRPAV